MAIDRPDSGHSLYFYKRHIYKLGNCARHFFYWREGSNEMHKPIKYAEKALTYAAGAAWVVFDKLNQINQNPSFTPKWSDKPLLKSYEKTKPPLGWPRETDSLCPRCVPEIRQEILDGKKPLDVLLQREGRRDQGADHRARRQDPDGEGLPASTATSRT